MPARALNRKFSRRLTVKVQYMCTRIVPVLFEFIAFPVSNILQAPFRFLRDNTPVPVRTTVAMDDFQSLVTIKQRVIQPFFDLQPCFFPGLTGVRYIYLVILFRECVM